jgi:hypothetical protein
MPRPSNPKSFRVADYGSEHTIFADDLVGVDDLGPVTHLTFSMAKRELDADRTGERLIVARIIIPTALRSQIARQLSDTAAAIEGNCPDQLQALH